MFVPTCLLQMIPRCSFTNLKAVHLGEVHCCWKVKPRGRDLSRFTLQIHDIKAVLQTAYLEWELHLSSSPRGDHVSVGSQYFLIFLTPENAKGKRPIESCC